MGILLKYFNEFSLIGIGGVVLLLHDHSGIYHEFDALLYLVGVSSSEPTLVDGDVFPNLLVQLSVLLLPFKLNFFSKGGLHL